MKSQFNLFLQIWLNIILALRSSNLSANQPYPAAGTPVNDGFFKKQLTDQEQEISQNYVHEGYAERQAQALCAKDGLTQDVCQGGETKTLGSTADGVVQAVSKMYGMFFNLPLNYKNGAGEDKNSSDPCALIPTGTESIASAYQSVNDTRLKNTPIDESTKQSELLYRASESHAAREKTAIIQASGWGTTSACYGALIIKRGIITGPSSLTQKGNYLLRLGASAGLAAYFGVRAKKAVEAKNITADIANKLRNIKGVCNPITENHCYCSQPETSSDAKYCAPKEVQDNQVDLKNPKIISSCVDSTLKVDFQCRCLQKNNCFDVTYKDLAMSEVGDAFLKNDFPSAESIFKGNANSAQLQNDTAQKFAAAKNFLKNIQGIPSVNLNAKQEREARALADLGLPLEMARFMASQELNDKGKKFLSEQANNPFNVSLNDFQNKKNAQYALGGGAARDSNVLYFGNGVNGSNSNNTNSNSYGAIDPQQYLNQLQNKNGNSQAQESKVLTFQEQQAVRKAEIHQGSSYSIFQILSHRYQSSTWRNFGVMQ